MNNKNYMKTNIKTNWLKFLIIILPLIFILIVLFCKEDWFVEMQKFPFNKNIWGSVSDWFMVYVTSITLIYIYQTLKSQQNVQSMQQKIVYVDAVRYINEIMPEIKISLVKKKSQGGNVYNVNIKLPENKSVPSDLRYEFQDAQFINDMSFLNGELSMTSILEDRFLICLIKQDNWPVTGLLSQLVFSYRDSIGTCYEVRYKIYADSQYNIQDEPKLIKYGSKLNPDLFLER